MTNKSLTKFDELDFFQVRTNLKDFLSARTEFQDHNFEGSVWSSMLDMMSYAIAYTGIHANMALSEAFLDSAQLRSSVVSRAKELNYFPRTSQASIARIKLSITSTADAAANNSTIAIPAQIRFAAIDANKSYIFTTTEVHTLTRIGLTDVYEGEISIVEGEFLQQNWTIPAIGVTASDLTITQKNIDTDYLTIDVRESSGSSVVTPYAYTKTLFKIKNDSAVYFLEETADGEIGIFFGDGIIGLPIEGGNIVEANYLVTSGRTGNGIGVFELIQDIGSYNRNSFSIELIDRAAGGADRESVQSIKFSAPRSFESQNRAVSANDYEQLITERFGFIESINTWGGEENDPPQYGRVFISIKPFDGIYISNAAKASIEELVLQRFNMVGIVPEIVNPDIIYISMDSIVIYDASKLSGSNNQLVADIKSKIQKYFADNLSRFNKTFRYSKLIAEIDNTNSAILNNRTKITLEKRFTPLGSATQIYEHKFSNELVPNSFTSNIIDTVGGVTYQYKDDGLGNIYQYRNSVKDILPTGQIDYNKGVAELRDFAFPWPSTENQEVRFTVETVSQDVLIKHNNIIILGDTDIILSKTLTT